jgi:hypothetical protein
MAFHFGTERRRSIDGVGRTRINNYTGHFIQSAERVVGSLGPRGPGPRLAKQTAAQHTATASHGIGGCQASQSRPSKADLAPAELDHGTMQCSRAESSIKATGLEKKKEAVDACALGCRSETIHGWIEPSMSRPILHHSHSRSQAAGCRLCRSRRTTARANPCPCRGPF